MNFTLMLGSIPIEVNYRKVKSIRLTVYPSGGKVKISSPQGMTREAIEKFAASKITWIKKHRDKFLKNPSNGKLQAGETLRNHSSVYIWGIEHRLELIEHTGAKASRANSKVAVSGGQMLMYIRPLSTKAKKMQILDRWYRRILKEAAEEMIKKWEEVIGVEVRKLYVRKMKSHWGSCNYEKQTLRLNSELAKRNPECLEYVIVHEMLHIIEKGHNKNFYRLLNNYIPDWKIIRNRMKTGL